MSNIDSFSRLCAQLAKLPGVGRKSAQRMAYHLLSQPADQVEALADAILTARHTVHECKLCGNYTDQDICPICADERRDGSTICVVRDPRDVAAIERMRDYNGPLSNSSRAGASMQWMSFCPFCAVLPVTKP